MNKHTSFSEPFSLLSLFFGGDFWGSDRDGETTAAEIMLFVPHPTKGGVHYFKQRKHHANPINI